MWRILGHGPEYFHQWFKVYTRQSSNLLKQSPLKDHVGSTYAVYHSICPVPCTLSFHKQLFDSAEPDVGIYRLE